MKGQNLQRIGNWTATVVLFAGIAYASLAMTGKPAYASSCNCTEEEQDAEVYCIAHGLGDEVYFHCPVGSDSVFNCTGDYPTEHVRPCD
jgi:hypothetical protein